MTSSLLPPLLPLGLLTLIIHFTHHGLQGVLLPRLINGSSIQSDGVSLLGLLGTSESVPSLFLPPSPPLSRTIQGGAQGHPPVCLGPLEKPQRSILVLLSGPGTLFWLSLAGPSPTSLGVSHFTRPKGTALLDQGLTLFC